MRAVDIIIKKRNGEELSSEEIKFFVQGFASGDIPDYQAAAWAMAVAIKGMSEQETTDLTLEMANSGETLDLSQVVPYVVDKHSTGGVGDKTSITVAPIVASCGLPVGKMSGRGLGFSGGTIDKLESIPGYRVNLTTEEFLSQLREIGIVLTGQSVDLAPADGKLYALRDVTGTVQSIPLIASSVMSKKIAAGAQAILLDVKTGKGAFMQTLEEAKNLAKVMVSIGKLSNRKVIAIISNMEQPLGRAVGNALELIEAVKTLKGEGPEDYYEHCMLLASHMLVMGKRANNLEQGRKMASEVIENGSAFEKLRSLVIAQGGDVRYIDSLEKLPSAKTKVIINCSQNGYVQSINARLIGEAAVLLGAGRQRKLDTLDLAVGIIVKKKIGDIVNKDEEIFEIHANEISNLEETKKLLNNSLVISDKFIKKPPLFFDIIED